MVLDFQEWVAIYLPDYKPWIGQWEDLPDDKNKFLVSIEQQSGGNPVVDVQYANYRVVLLGPQNGKNKKLQVMADAQLLIDAAIKHEIMPCGAANVRSLGAAMGPGLTAENRPWAQLTFELIF